MFEGLIGFLVFCVVLCFVGAVIWYMLSLFSIPEPFNRAIRVCLALIACLLILMRALPLLGIHSLV